MKKAWVLVGGLLSMATWHVYAGDVSGNAPPSPPETAVNAEGPVGAAGTMSGAPSADLGMTRAQVREDLIDSQSGGQAARARALYKGAH
jgi:hypothetical protein